MDCDSDLDEFRIVIEDVTNRDVVDTILEDERDFEYDTSDPPQFYDVFIEISHDFEDGEEIECEFEADGKFKRTYDYDESGFERIFIENELNFGESFVFDCDETIDSIFFIVSNNTLNEVEIFEKEIERTKSVSFKLTDIPEEEPSQNQTPESESELEPRPNPKPTQTSEAESKPKPEPQINITANVTQGAQNQETQDSNQSLESSNSSQTNQSAEEISQEPKSSFPIDVILVIGVLIVIFVVLVVIGIKYLK